MNRSERGYLRQLERRRDWLLARVAIAEHTGKQPLSYDAHELSALEWALERLEALDATQKQEAPRA